jgi:hypothetical protein
MNRLALLMLCAVACSAPCAVADAAGGPAVAANDAPGAYLRMKKAQIKLIFSTEPNAQPEPALEMLIPATWNFTGGLIPTKNLQGGCFSDSFPLGIESKSPDGSMGFQKIAEYSWQYSDDPQELQKLDDPNRRAYGGQREGLSGFAAVDRGAVLSRAPAAAAARRHETGLDRSLPRARRHRSPADGPGAPGCRQRGSD